MNYLDGENNKFHMDVWNGTEPDSFFFHCIFHLFLHIVCTLILFLILSLFSHYMQKEKSCNLNIENEKKISRSKCNIRNSKLYLISPGLCTYNSLRTCSFAGVLVSVYLCGAAIKILYNFIIMHAFVLPFIHIIHIYVQKKGFKMGVK